MIRIIVSIQVAALTASDHLRERLAARVADDRGQSTAEYALVLLGAAGVAALLIAWATKTGKITSLLNTMLDRVLAKGV